MSFYNLPDTIELEIQDLEQRINKYKNGEISAMQLRVYRVPFGVYEQRIDGTFMVRIRNNGGAITPKQLKEIGLLSNEYGSGLVHVTTRQELQIHNVDLDNVIAIIRRLKSIELTSRGGGGNTIRNVMSSADSGLFDDDVFDVMPYSYTLMNKLIQDKGSWELPRKFKITFSSKKNVNNAHAHVQDIGFIAKEKNGARGFKVYCAGGMGNSPDLGVLLHEFIPEEEFFIVAQSLIEVFSENGNRKNRNKARLRHLINDIGKEELFRLYAEKAEVLKKDRSNYVSVDRNLFHNGVVIDNINISPISIQNVEEYTLWEKRYVKQQIHKGFYAVYLPIFLGNFNGDEVVELASFLENFGDNSIRLTMNQNMYIRNIPEEYLPNLFYLLKKIFPLVTQSPILGNSISCTGADTCRLGVCLPKGLLRAIDEKFQNTSLDLDMFSDLKINASGCPNTCGQHMVADIGFFGLVGKNGQDSYPSYNIVAGASAQEGEMKLATKITDINAKCIPDFLEELLIEYSKKRDQFNSFSHYVDNEGKEDILTIANKFKDLPLFSEDAKYYYDWGSKDKFSLAGHGKGECSAGLFDLINFDMKLAKTYIDEASNKDSIQGEDVYKIIMPTCRSLLITKGLEAKDEKEVFSLFTKEFIDTSLVDDKYSFIVEAGRFKKFGALQDELEGAKELLKDMKELYKSMDQSLKFPKEKEVDITKSDEEESSSSLRKKDLSGVSCPINFVKTKLELSQMNANELLEIILDDGAPIKNVPRSVEQEGHLVLEKEQLENSSWRVLIKKI